jgi:hypothetical protein
LASVKRRASFGSGDAVRCRGDGAGTDLADLDALFVPGGVVAVE